MTRVESQHGPARQVRLGDGRMLAYAEFGDPTGKPVFYIHGSNGSRLERHPDESIAVSLGVRIITVDRPGHGHSDFQPARKLLDWTDDVEALADSLNIGRFAAIGFSSGGPHVAACAFKVPHRLTSAGIISGVATYDRPGASRGVNLIWRSVLGLLRRVPWILNPPTSPMSYMARSNPGLLVDLMASQMMKSDQALISEPKVKEVFTQSISESFRFGGRGTIAEGALLVRLWGFQLADISIQVHLWQREVDTVEPLQMGQSLAHAIPVCHTTIIPGEGHMLIFSHWREIIPDLVS